MYLLLIGIVAFAASALTFFSGFGLGTILLPVFSIFFPAPVAVALTAVVHLLNNLFKLGLTGRYIHLRTLLWFGIPALIAAYFGAQLLLRLSDLPAFHTYQLGEATKSITPVKLVIAVLLAVFALLELFGKDRIAFSARWLPVGGVLSGFFGGLSGHQGALRSAFLIRSGLSKEAFIATGVAIACLIDVSRLAVYEGDLLGSARQNWPVLATAILAAFAGAFLGSKSLKKTTIRQLQQVVGILLLFFALLMGVGVV